MKKKELVSIPSFHDPTQEKLKRAKTVTLIAKTRQTYLANLEKKLDEIMTASADQKKGDKRNMNNNLSPQNLALFPKQSGGMKAQNEQNTFDSKLPKKTRMCKMYLALKMCRNGDACPFAHHQGELDVEYKPKEWVKIFSQSSQKTLNRLDDASKSQSDFRKTIDSSKFKMTGNFFKSQKDENIISVDKIMNTKGRTLLIEACVMNDLEIKSGARVSQKDWLGNDSIFYAIKNSNPAMLEVLLKFSQEKINLDERFTIARYTYLILAAKMGNLRMLEILLKYGSNPNITDKPNKSALFYCVEGNFIKGVELLLNHGADFHRIDIYGKTILDYAYDRRYIDILDLLIRTGAFTNDPTKNKSLILISAQHNLKEALDDLIKRGMSTNEVDENGNHILLIAYENGHLNLIEYLINSYGLANIINTQNKRKDNLLLRVIKDQNEYLIQYLLNNPNVDLDSKDEILKTSLMYAAETGDYQTTEALLQKGINPNITDKYGRTALIFACKNEHILTVEVLLKYEVNILWKDYVGRNAKNYSKNKLINSLLRHYMIDKGQLSDSLIKELEEEKYNIKKILESG